MLFALLTTATLAVAAEPVPYGHPDFYPSPERPLGWRGDGTGAWPGATPVSSWDATKNVNIVWRTPMPGAGFAQPIVVGEKVFTMADPDLLVCVGVHDGRILWQTRIEHTLNLPAADRERATAEMQWIEELRRRYGAWWQRVQALQKKLQDSGIDPKAIIAKPPSRGEIGVPADAAMQEAHGKALSLPGVKTEFDALVAEAQREGFLIPHGYDPIIQDRPVHPNRARAIRGWEEFDLLLDDQWGEKHVTRTFATPCTDGRLIYVTTAYNAVAAVDFSGVIRWLVWERIPDERMRKRKPAEIGTRFAASPVFYQGRLIVNQNGLLRVYDPATGKKLWEVWNPGNKLHGTAGSQFPWRPIPEGCSPTVTTLRTPDGKPLAVIGTGGSILYRLADGKPVCADLPNTAKGHTPFFVGDLYIWKTSGDNQPVSRKTFRLTAKDADTVIITELWKMERDGGGAGASDAYHDGIIYSGSFAVRALTGEIIRPAVNKGGVSAHEGPSPIVAGNFVVGVDKGRLQGDVQSREGGPVTRNPFVDRRNLGEDEEFTQRYGWWTLRASGNGFPSNSSPSAQANRLFWRSLGYLWCIGDPQQPFPAPKDCPAEARVK